jgi:hypothetical protein
VTRSEGEGVEGLISTFYAPAHHFHHKKYINIYKMINYTRIIVALATILLLASCSFAQSERARDENLRRHAGALRALIRAIPNLQSSSAYGANKWNQESLQNASQSSWCNFFGIKCYEEPGLHQGLIKKLSLADVGIEGTVLSVITELEALEHLDLSGNRLSGAVPVSSLNILRSLKHLDLSENILDSFDAFFNGTNLAQLKHVILSSNNFSGSIPHSLIQLPGLQTLLIDSNNWSGDIPTELSSIQTLQALDLSHNQNLSGCLPDFTNVVECSVLDTNISCACGRVPVCGLPPCAAVTSPSYQGNLNMPESLLVTEGPYVGASGISETTKIALIVCGTLAAVAFVLFLALVGMRLHKRYIAQEPWYNPENKLCWWV